MTLKNLLVLSLVLAGCTSSKASVTASKVGATAAGSGETTFSDSAPTTIHVPDRDPGENIGPNIQQGEITFKDIAQMTKFWSGGQCISGGKVYSYWDCRDHNMYPYCALVGSPAPAGYTIKFASVYNQNDTTGKVISFVADDLKVIVECSRGGREDWTYGELESIFGSLAKVRVWPKTE